MNGLMMDRPLLISSLLTHAESQHSDQEIDTEGFIAARHAKWDERPLLVVAKKLGHAVTRDELLGFYEGKVAKWWTPDDVVFVDCIPVGATGKVQKNLLRDAWGDHLLAKA
jgi:fatty-acyl-CoA synthase